MTITEQIRLKLKTVDKELEATFWEPTWKAAHHSEECIKGHIERARRILRDICELDGSDERTT